MTGLTLFLLWIIPLAITWTCLWFSMEKGETIEHFLKNDAMVPAILALIPFINIAPAVIFLITLTWNSIKNITR